MSDTCARVSVQVHRCLDLNPLQFFRVAPPASARSDDSAAAAAPGGGKGVFKVPSLLFDIEARAPCWHLPFYGPSSYSRRVLPACKVGALTFQNGAHLLTGWLSSA